MITYPLPTKPSHTLNSWSARELTANLTARGRAFGPVRAPKGDEAEFNYRIYMRRLVNGRPTYNQSFWTVRGCNWDPCKHVA